MARLTGEQKRLRGLARLYGRMAARDIQRAIRDQQDVAWFAAQPALADLAPDFQRRSDRSLDYAARWARTAARWALWSEEAV